MNREVSFPAARILDEEIRGYLDMAARDCIERGESPCDTGCAPGVAHINLVKEVARDMWG